MTVNFFNWQGGLQPGAPYTRTSPNLDLVRAELIKRFDGSDLGGYFVRPVRGGNSWSSHAFGSAIDVRIRDSRQREAAIAWLTTNFDALGVQVVHNYVGSRLWRANRYPGQPVGAWWRPQQRGGDWGNPSATWLHVETDRSNWANTSPIAQRLSPPTPPAPVLFDPANGVWGLYPLNPNKGKLFETTTPPTAVNFDLTRYLQGVLRLKASQPIPVDGDFGPSTDQAVKNLQRFLGMVVDGVVGQKTWAVIDSLSGK